MKQSLYLIIFLFIYTSCKSDKLDLKNYESEILKIEKLSDNVFKHISYLDTEDYGKVPCNGMIFVNNNEAVIFDTPTNNKASETLINWLGKTNIEAVVISHFHVDCLGGLQAFHANSIKSYSNKLTIELAKQDNQILPKNGFDNKIEINVGGVKVFAEFFGEGHTKDNIVGYIPTAKTLFGGCLIKAFDSSKGNLNDANTLEWSKTVSRIKKEMSELETVIPGHGKSGGIELLEYTIELFNEK
ncbi:subclass B1 metallo-beta-lactamase [uncultured Psychroserpens sp.]|uniref:subclass B1 metallo-beta-lactamase n=1 Tax=uncultured Psychroserpens sp. TaxID=255436 RepID=UPI002619E440|nr:subclass B1 metallo-beta-lactamase [uncultured Psychroserpens sp.]